MRLFSIAALVFDGSMASMKYTFELFRYEPGAPPAGAARRRPIAQGVCEVADTAGAQALALDFYKLRWVPADGTEPPLGVRVTDETGDEVYCKTWWDFRTEDNARAEP